MPLTWSEAENVAWKTEIRGRGWSSPVVDDDTVWLTTADPEGHERAVLALSLATGKVLLDRVLFEVEEPEHRNDLNSYASPSCVLDGERVFVFFGSVGIACLDAQSHELLWERTDLVCDHMMGPGSSPLLLDGRLIIHYDGGDVQYVVSLDAETGETVWRQERSYDFTGVADDLRKAYGTPVPVRGAERTVIISTGAQATYGYDAADGKELWQVRHKGFSMSARPLVSGDLALVNTGFMRAELWAVRLGGEGDVTETHVAWNVDKAIATMATGVIVGDLVFQVTDGGIVSCIDLSTGEQRWRERVTDEVCASLLAVGDRVYLSDRVGKTVVLAAKPELEVLAENHLDDGCMASHAVADGALLVRTKTHLYRLEQGAKAAGEGER